MNRMKIMAAALTVFCMAAGAGLIHAAASAVPASGSAVQIAAEDIPVNDEIYGLSAKLSSSPEKTSLNAEGQPDLSGIRVNLFGINAEGKRVEILHDASLEEAKTRFHVEIQTEPLDPSGWSCDITFTVYNSKYQSAFSDHISLMLEQEMQTTPSGTTQTTSAQTTAAQTTSAKPDTTTAMTATTTAASVTTTASTVSTTATTVTTTVTSAVSAKEPAFLLGDCNADKSFTVADAVALSKWLSTASAKLPDPKAADMDGNAVLNAADLTLMKRSLLGKLPEFPVQNPVVIDSFTPCRAQLTDKFSAWRILVTIKHQYSDPSRTWTIQDFPGIDNIKSVKQHTNAEPYRQVLEIALKEPSKEHVLELIHGIEALECKEIKEVQVIQDMMGDN